MNKFSTECLKKWRKSISVYHFFISRIRLNRLSQVAGSLSFTSVLSIIPLLVVTLSVLTGFPVFEKFQKEIQVFMLENLMPDHMSKIIMKQISRFAEKSSQLSVVGGVLLLFSALLTMATIDKVFNEIWQVKRSGLFRKNILVYWTVLTAGPILFGIFLLLSNYMIDKISKWPEIKAILNLAIPFCTATFAFSALYTLVPNRKIAWRDSLIGGAVSATLFVIFTKSFSIMFNSLKVYAILYSAFSIIPAFFLWLYLFWWLVLLGASIAASLPLLRFESWSRETKPGTALHDALMIMYLLLQARKSESRTSSWESLQNRLHLNTEDLAHILELLEKHGWAGRVRKSDGSTAWALICEVNEVHLSHLYDAFVFDSRHFSDKARQDRLPWADYLTKIHQSGTQSPSLGELFSPKK